MKKDKTQLNIEEHPFPNKEFNLILKLNQEGKIPVEDIAIISNLLHKYVSLRADVFYPE